MVVGRGRDAGDFQVFRHPTISQQLVHLVDLSSDVQQQRLAELFADSAVRRHADEYVVRVREHGNGHADCLLRR